MLVNALLAILFINISLTLAFTAPSATALFQSRSISKLRTPKLTVSKYARKSISLFSSNGQGLDDATKNKIENILGSSKIVLFMKGNKTFPQCGFSNTACRILQALNTDFTAVNVLDDDKIRQGIKTYSMWPTIPQLYINGEFIGGSDIMIELYQSGELAEKVEFANAN